MAIGHFLMAFEPAFLLALCALLLGVGAFKGTSRASGALYMANDLRRAMAFQIFYIAINVSVDRAPARLGHARPERWAGTTASAPRAW
jgi:POT family proton-dependent oligopeptide transporter